MQLYRFLQASRLLIFLRAAHRLRLDVDGELANRYGLVFVVSRRLFLDLLQYDWLVVLFLSLKNTLYHGLSAEGVLDQGKFRSDVDLEITRVDGII